MRCKDIMQKRKEKWTSVYNQNLQVPLQLLPKLQPDVNTDPLCSQAG